MRYVAFMLCSCFYEALEEVNTVTLRPGLYQCSQSITVTFLYGMLTCMDTVKSYIFAGFRKKMTFSRTHMDSKPLPLQSSLTVKSCYCNQYTSY